MSTRLATPSPNSRHAAIPPFTTARAGSAKDVNSANNADSADRDAAIGALTGIERLMAEALLPLQPDAVDPGECEYASWLRLLRRGTP